MTRKAILPPLDLANAMTLRALHARLGELLLDDTDAGNRPVVVRLAQAPTAAGRRRPTVEATITGADRGALLLDVGGGRHGCTALRAGTTPQRGDPPIFHLYRVTGNTTPMRLGRVFPTGWTVVSRPGEALTIAAKTRWPYKLRGTHVEPCGEMALRDVMERRVLGAY